MNKHEMQEVKRYISYQKLHEPHNPGNNLLELLLEEWKNY